MKPLRSLARLVGRALVGGSLVLFALAIALCSVGVYLLAVPYAKVSRRHAKLVAAVQVAQALAVLGATLKREPDELDELDQPTAK